MAEAVFVAAGAAPQIDYVPMPLALRERYQYLTEARLDRLREVDPNFSTPLFVDFAFWVSRSTDLVIWMTPCCRSTSPG